MRKGGGEKGEEGRENGYPLSTPSVMVQRFCGQLLVFNTDLPNLDEEYWSFQYRVFYNTSITSIVG
jgi:hypothetical protein